MSLQEVIQQNEQEYMYLTSRTWGDIDHASGEIEQMAK